MTKAQAKKASAAALVLLLLFNGHPAEAADPEPAANFVNRVLVTHQSLTSADLPGVIANKELRSTFFAGPHVEFLPQLADRIHPLTGSSQPSLTTFTVGGVQSTGPDTAEVSASVTTGGTTTDILLTVAGSERFRIVDVASGRGAQAWSMRNMLSVLATLSGSGGPASAGKAPADDAATGSAGDVPQESATAGVESDEPSSQPAATSQPASGEQTEADRAALAAADPAASGEAAAAQAATESPATRALRPFADEFEGASLDPEWTVRHRDDRALLVDDGEVLVLARGGGPQFNLEAPTNLMVLEGRTLAGDFDMSIDMRIEPKTGAEWVWLGLRASARDWVAASMLITWGGCGKAMNLRIDNLRDLDPDADPVRTRFNTKLFFGGPFADNICGKGRAYADRVLEALAADGFRLTLKKRGFLYTAEIEMNLPASEDREGGPVVFETSAVARFEPFGEPALLFGQRGRTDGGSTGMIERFALKPVP